MKQPTVNVSLHVPLNLASLWKTRCASLTTGAVVPATTESQIALRCILNVRVGCVNEQLLGSWENLATDIMAGFLAPQALVYVCVFRDH